MPRNWRVADFSSKPLMVASSGLWVGEKGGPLALSTHAAGVAAGGVRGDRVEALLRRVLVGDRRDAGPGQARSWRDDLADPVVVEGAAVAHHAHLAAGGLVEAGEERDRGAQQDH